MNKNNLSNEMELNQDYSAFWAIFVTRATLG